MLPRISSDRGDTFRSYIDVHSDEATSQDASKFADLSLLIGEIVSSSCEDVLFFPSFRENQFGKLLCTNFRICFLPLTTQQREPCCSRSLVLSDDFHFPLCSIVAVYYASSPMNRRSVAMSKKFRLMTVPASQLDIVSCIKIFTKDFRIWTFDLQKSQSAVTLANSIYHFSRPVSLYNFFHIACKNYRVSLPSRLADSSIAFNNQKDWLEEVSRCRVDKALWRICFLGSDKRRRGNVVPSYPLYVIVPSEIPDCTVIEVLAPNWRNRRFPVWCWSSPNGCALMRSSHCCREMNEKELWEMYDQVFLAFTMGSFLLKIMLPLCRAHPRNRRPHIVDIDIPTSKISMCFEKLREFCSIECITQYNEREKDWYSLLDGTGWCSLIFQCLSYVREVLQKMIESQRSVIITEDEGYDLSTVVSSLVQICADRFYRTINGLNKLIEKEWIALGHPFGANIFHCTVDSRAEPPHSCIATFLVFLDCLSQLLRLYPASFQYSQYMLIALWDLCITGLAPALVCNSVSDQALLERNVSVFPLSQYYSSKYCLMFTNVASSANCLLGIGGLPTVIQPSANPFDVEFWSECYLRWVSPANIQEGGIVARDLALSSILAGTLSLVDPSCEHVVWRHRLHPAFDAKKISSAFPYSDATDSEFIQNEVVPLSRADSFKSLRVDLNATYPVASHTGRRLSGSFISRPASATPNRPKNSRQLFSPSTGTLV